MPAPSTSSPRRGRSPSVLPVRVGADEARVNRRAKFGFTTSETQAALAMLSHPVEVVLEASPSLGAGLRGLRGRGLVLLPPADAATDVSGVLQARWTDAAALAAAARRTTIPFNLGMRSRSLLLHAADVLSEPRRTYTATGLALVLAHRYQFTGVHALTITPLPTAAPATPGATSSQGDDGQPAGYEVVEHRHHHPDRVRLLPSVMPNPQRLRQGAPGLDTDQRRVLLPDDMEALAVQAFYRGRGADDLSSGTAGAVAPVCLDLGRLVERPTAPETAPSWMPALLADALDHLGVSETVLPAPEFFHSWAHERLRYPLRCGAYTHVRQIDPSTGTVHTPVEYAEQYATEEMLTALRLPVGESTGCAAAEEFLPMALDGTIWGAVTDEIVLRWVVRAVQYLDAGLDLQEASDFLLFAIPADHAADLVARRRRGEFVAVSEQLFSWVRALLNRGTIN